MLTRRIGDVKVSAIGLGGMPMSIEGRPDRERSIATIHANAPRDALHRLEMMMLLSGISMPEHTIREQIASAIQLLVHAVRFSDGSRRITRVSEIVGMAGDAIVVDCDGCVVVGDGGTAAAMGLRDTVVVHVNGATLACPLDRSEHVRKVSEAVRAREAT